MHVAERNQDVIDILRKINFGRGRGISQNNHIIWFASALFRVTVFHRHTITTAPMYTLQFTRWGNLNYRVELPVKHKLQATTQLIESGEWAVLRDFDQLLKNMAARKVLLLKDGGGVHSSRLTTQLLAAAAPLQVFLGFEEATLAFPPSYKYDTASTSGAFDAQSVPAWKERVLFHSRKQGSSASCFYGSVPTTLANQRPVASILRLDVVETRDADLDSIRSQLSSPLCALSSSVIVTPPMTEESLTKLLEPFGTIDHLHLLPERAIVRLATIEVNVKGAVFNWCVDDPCCQSL